MYIFDEGTGDWYDRVVAKLIDPLDIVNIYVWKLIEVVSGYVDGIPSDIITKSHAFDY